MIFSRAADFGYGNTRLRARRTAILRADDYQQLIDLDLDELLDLLQRRSAISETAPDSGNSLQQLHMLIQHDLGSALEDMRSFYRGRARELVDVLLSRYDLANMITILRAGARPDLAPDHPLQAVIPVGWLRPPVASQILRSDGLAGVVELMARALPDRDQARALHNSFEQYQRTKDLAALERAVIGDHTKRSLSRLGRSDRSSRTLIRFLQQQADQDNLLVTLRLRDAILSGADDTPPPAETLLPGGAISQKSFDKIRHEPDAAAVVTWLGTRYGHPLRTPLQRWVSDGDLLELQRTLDRNTIASTIRLFVSGDPLAIDIPLAYAAEKQLEAQELRLLGEAAARGIPRDVVNSELSLSMGSS
ncbi:V-type ATPase subunit [Microlunatus sp. Gsoil 973]|uniref:V0D/AC39 family V-type ATPase subunit n=1 Tax=Microlunatus sp. Gsoil 973 TaxID=2672569 RepID=UPI0012B451F0|nr:V-type ATPase subunit [Microlunatus sp. Gsoil 973]QGN34407.1 hypothetical protein GJV80_18065 [Microlunatus sp. Gsoil 973]